MRLPGTIARLTAVLLVIGCKDAGPQRPTYLTLTGTVREYRSTGDGPTIAGAAVSVVFEGNGYVPVGDGSILASSVTRPDGTYQMLVPTPPGYAFPNCKVMWVQ